VDSLEFPDATVALAYCTVLAYDSMVQYGHVTNKLQKTCDRVDCRRCNLLGRLLLQHKPQGLSWVCSECAHLYPHHVGFWADGACDSCSKESIVLQLVETAGTLVHRLHRMEEDVR